jgi:mannosyl-oligosaccharide alpha-1,2-mannosidase
MDMRFFFRRRVLIGATISLLVIFLFSSSSERTLFKPWNPERHLLAERQQHVTAAFEHAWSGYSKHCMGHDSLHPVSNTCDDDFGGWGASAIDALSTAILMEKEEIVLDIMRFISDLDFSQVKGGTSIQVFEVIIRHFGGMISAYDLLNGPFSKFAADQHLRQRLYEQMVKLADILTCAFNTPSGVPRNWLNPATCTTDEGTSNTLAGAGSMILEFARLSDITGNRTYADLAKKAQSHLLDPSPKENEPYPGLLGAYVQVSDGWFVSSKGGWGSLSDSFYEYLIKAYVYDRTTYAAYLQRWLLAADSTIRLVASKPYGRANEVFLPFWEDQRRFNAMDSLSWFAGGNFILGGMVTQNQTLVDFGVRIADTAGALYKHTASHLGPEWVHWTPDCSSDWGEKHCSGYNSVRPADTSFQLRPEALETWYYAYRATRDPKYREWAWDMFLAINKVCRTDTGFSAISNVTATDGGQKLDKQESFVFAEMLKYMWLIHVEVSDNPLNIATKLTFCRTHMLDGTSKIAVQA